MRESKIKIENLIKKSKEERIRHISLLVDEINKKRLAVFVGAGCSISVGLPSWSVLIGDILKKHNIKSKESDLFRLASRVERDLGPLKFREEISDRLRLDLIGKSELHNALINMETNLFITTNYDTILEDYFKLQGVSPSILRSGKDIPSIDPTRKTIIKLHGDINSPMSLVLTASDYSKYKNEDKAFIDWLQSIATQKSILFVGASFEDPRLKDVDDYILNIFGRDARRQPFIFFKIPKQDIETSDEDFNIEIDDFEVLCDEFRERGFYLILVKKYDEIVEILNKVNKKVLEDKLETDPESLSVQIKLQVDYSKSLEKKLNSLIEKEIKEYRNKIFGNGRLPGLNKVNKYLNELIDFLRNPPHRLTEESNLEGLLCATDALLIVSSSKEDIIKARDYYKKANEVFQGMENKSGFQERLIRLRAKLLFQEGKIDESIDSLANSKNPKTISFWLLYLIEAKRIEEALDFIEKNKIKMQWVSEVLRIYVTIGKIQEAEELFWKVLKDFEAEKEKGNIEKTDYKGDFFIENICFVMIFSLYHKAVQDTGKKVTDKIYPYDFKSESKFLLRKCLIFIDVFFKKSHKALEDNDNYRAIEISHIEMDVCYYLGEFEQSDNAAKRLIPVSPIDKRIVYHVLRRQRAFPESTLKVISKKLAKDHPDQAWSLLEIAHIESQLGNNDDSWNALKKTFTLPFDDEKNETLILSFKIGNTLGKLDEVFLEIKNLVEFEKDEGYFWECFYKSLSGKHDEAIKGIDELNELNLDATLRVWIRLLKAGREIEKQNWEEARKLLEESMKIQPDLATLMALLTVLTRLQDNVAVLKTTENIESFGLEDDQVTLIKAQAARNLRQYNKSEASWRKLNKKFPEDPAYAFGLAYVMMFQEREKEALKVLEPFIKPNKKLDLDCLKLAVQIYSSLGDNNKAFSILEKCFTKIKNDPALLMQHVDVGFKAGKEEEAIRSLERLDELKEKGEVPDNIFIKSNSLKDLLKVIKEKEERKERVDALYRSGKIPRIMLSEDRGNSLYLDWAVRTQPLDKEFLESNEGVNYTVYTTDGFRIKANEKRKNQLSQIESPREVKEIVIDYHALITVHQLGFMDKLCRRYKKIYYPDVFRRLWKMELAQYTPFQPSRIEIFKKLEKKINRNEIKDAVSPVTYATFIEKYLSLARIEKVPIIDNYIEAKELSEFQEVPVIRVLQLVDWIYEKGRISENKWQEIKKYSSGGKPIVKENWRDILNNSMRFVIAPTTLELMENFDINQILIDMGVLLLIEKNTANEIRFNLRNYEFEEDVVQWHNDMVRKISEKSEFIEVYPEYEKNEKNIVENLYWEAAYAPIKYCNNNKLFLLTDDRWIQRAPRHFGTDALLRDLFNNKIIDIREYTEAFLKLCKWRYLFLLPDKQILIFLAEQYKAHLPGRELELIASYLGKNMDDPGLPLSLEPVDPPIPIGYKYYLSITNIWLEFLAEIWQDSNFDKKYLNIITDWFFRYARPYLPSGIQGDIRIRLNKELDRIIFDELFLIILNSRNHKQLHMLIEKSFENISSDTGRKESELIRLINYTKQLCPFGKRV